MPPKILDSVARAAMIEHGVRPDEGVPYPGNKKPWPGVCIYCNTRTSPSYVNVVVKGQGGCRFCGYKVSGMKRVAPDALARTEMVRRNIRPDVAVQYPGADKPWAGVCLRCGGRVSPSYDHVVNGGQSGCWTCGREALAKVNMLPDHEARKRMVERGVQPDSDIPYPGSTKPWPGICLVCYCPVAPIYAGVVYHGKGACSNCARYGMVLSEPSYVYLIVHDQFAAVKIGIANARSKRMDSFKARKWRELETWRTVDGFSARMVERKVLASWRSRGIPLGVDRLALAPYGGETETAPLSMVNLSETILLVEDLLLEQRSLREVA